MDTQQVEPIQSATRQKRPSRRRLLLALKEQVQAKDAALSRVEQLEKERQYMRREITNLKSALSEKTIRANGETQNTDKSLQDERDKLREEVKMLKALCEAKRNCVPLDAYTRLQKERKREKSEWQEEMDRVHSQVSRQKSVLREKTLTTLEALRKVKILEEEKSGLQLEREDLCLKVANLESALHEKNAALDKAQSKVKTLKSKKAALRSSKKNLKTVIRKERKDIEVYRSKVTEQEQEIRKQKAMIEECHAKFSAVCGEKQDMEKKVQDLKRETEHLQNEHRKEVTVLQSSEEEKKAGLQQKIEKLCDALKSSQKNNAALFSYNLELQKMIRSKDEQIQETENQRKRKKTWFGDSSPS